MFRKLILATIGSLVWRYLQKRMGRSMTGRVPFPTSRGGRR